MRGERERKCERIRKVRCSKHSGKKVWSADGKKAASKHNK